MLRTWPPMHCSARATSNWRGSASKSAKRSEREQAEARDEDAVAAQPVRLALPRSQPDAFWRAAEEILWDIDEHATLFIEPNAARAGAGRITLAVVGLDALL